MASARGSGRGMEVRMRPGGGDDGVMERCDRVCMFVCMCVPMYLLDCLFVRLGILLSIDMRLG